MERGSHQRDEGRAHQGERRELEREPLYGPGGEPHQRAGRRRVDFSEGPAGDPRGGALLNRPPPLASFGHLISPVHAQALTHTQFCLLAAAEQVAHPCLCPLSSTDQCIDRPKPNKGRHMGPWSIPLCFATLLPVNLSVPDCLIQAGSKSFDRFVFAFVLWGWAWER